MVDRRRSRHDRDHSAEQQPSDFGTYVGGLANVVYKGVAAEVAPYDLSPVDVQMMLVFRETHECTATYLARLLPVDATRISRQVTGLVDKGLLLRRRLREDRRIVMLRLSPEGEELASELSERMNAYYARLTEGFSEEEMRAFATIAQGIIANYEAMQE